MTRSLHFSINVTPDGNVDHRVGLADEELHANASANIAGADALLLGRNTYQLMESAWRPKVQRPAWTEPFARTIDAAKKYVVSTTLGQVDWNAELLTGDLGTAVRALKARPGKRLAVGGAKLGMSLAQLGLIDEYELIVHPRLTGGGPKLMEGLTRHVDLKLVDQRVFKSGQVALRYVPK